MWLNRPRLSTLGDVEPEQAAPVAPAVRAMTIPEGDDGTVITLRMMRDFVRQSIMNPQQVIRAKVREIYSGLPPRQYWREVCATHAYVRDQIRYTKDPYGVELVQTPERTLEYAQGDCDDKATLLAALLTAGGHPCRFVAMGFDDGPFSHVLVDTKVGNRWVPLETIIPREAGWYPPGVKRAYRLKV